MSRNVALALAVFVLSKSSLHAQNCVLRPMPGMQPTEAQHWRLVPVGDGMVVIENVRLTRERGFPMVLDYRDGNSVYLERLIPAGAEAQHWRVRRAANGLVAFENVRLTRERGFPMVLDYRDGNSVYLERLIPAGAEAQQWRLVYAIGTDRVVIENSRLTRERGGPVLLDY